MSDGRRQNLSFSQIWIRIRKEEDLWTHGSEFGSTRTTSWKVNRRVNSEDDSRIYRAPLSTPTSSEPSTTFLKEKNYTKSRSLLHN